MQRKNAKQLTADEAVHCFFEQVVRFSELRITSRLVSERKVSATGTGSAVIAWRLP